MLVSAMTAKNATIAISQTNGVCVNSKGVEEPQDQEVIIKKNLKNEYVKSSKAFDQIFDWHNFCNSQIEKGKLDIIA